MIYLWSGPAENSQKNEQVESIPLLVVEVFGWTTFFAINMLFVAFLLHQSVSIWRRMVRERRPLEPWMVGGQGWSKQRSPALFSSDLWKFIALAGVVPFLLILPLFLTALIIGGYREDPTIPIWGLFALALLNAGMYYFWVYGLVIGAGLAMMALNALPGRIAIGRRWITFDQFPIFLGESLDVRFRTSRKLAKYRNLRFALRCLAENTDQSGPPEVSEHEEWYPPIEHYASEQFYDQLMAYEINEKECPLSFSLPDSNLGTERDPWLHWVLEVYGECNGRPFQEEFYLPVYARPGPAPAAS